VRVNVGRNLADDRAGKVAIQAIDQNGFQCGSLKDDVLLAGGRIQISVVAGRSGSSLRLGLGLRWSGYARARNRGQLLLLLGQRFFLLCLQDIELLLEISRQTGNW